MRLSNILEQYEEYRRFRQVLDTGTAPISVAGVAESAQAQLIYETAMERGAVVIAYSDMEARALYDDLCYFTERARYFPAKEYVFYNIEATGREREHQRLACLHALAAGGESAIIVTSLEAALDYTVGRTELMEYTVPVEPGMRLDLEALSQKLVEMGYVREELVEGKGQFSVRGGILDYYPVHREDPVRIEFFDDEVDSIRTFDAMTQRSMEPLDRELIIPCREAVFPREKTVQIIAALEEKIKKLKRKKSDQSQLIEKLRADMEQLREGGSFPAIDKYVSLIYGRVPTILEYFGHQDLAFIIEPKRIAERAKSLEWEQGELLGDLSGRGILLLDGMEFWLDYAKMKETVSQMGLVSLNTLSHSTVDYQYKAIFNFTTKTTVGFHGKVDYLYDDLQAWQKEGATVVILAGNRARGENLAGTLNDKGIACRFTAGRPEFQKGEIVVTKGELRKGFSYPEIDFVLISDQEIFESSRKRRARKIENTNRIKAYTDIQIGDYVVHQTHGIGQYAGIQKMVVGGVTKDYLKIQYQGTDSLYVPVDQMDMLYKYVGSTEKKLKLNKLGGTDWNKTKARVKSSTRDMAKQLVALYAERENTKGFAFSSDTPWQRDFEDTFLYSETDDQLRSIEEVKQDMERPKPMDRLLCGDVGYGKTEVALRAAFKAATDSKQVAYLCPTTILAMQHYDTFVRRMENFPIKIQMLSRFRTPAQQKEILKQLKTGEIDIIIGTHRILQKDLEFKDLGLLIIDEEQRFGVADKERLKEMKKNVDVLSMTATPIPRTLHMAMINVRDMSLLETPPENRYPVQTYVLEQNEAILADAMKKELARGGQVFYLYNRVQGIYRTAQWIQKMIPEATVAVGHGKMKEDELEDIMYDMVNGKTDILVCTTIIETGLDIPNANTIIIENADRMGLSQLYQLRGRVGRSNRSAYAYLTYRKNSVLSDTAEKRLRAIKEFTEFGSGFKIAMRDLEIRGAGNILGAEQHGHMDAVGYDMYCKLLKESVDEARGLQTAADTEIAIDADMDAYIPEQYIPSHGQRIEIYKKIAAVEDDEDASEITDELIDRFGDIPKAVENLIGIAAAKAAGRRAGVCEIAVKGDRAVLRFLAGALQAETVLRLIDRFPKNLSVGASEQPVLTYRCDDSKKLLSNIKFILQTILELQMAEKYDIIEKKTGNADTGGEV